MDASRASGVDLTTPTQRVVAILEDAGPQPRAAVGRALMPVLGLQKTRHALRLAVALGYVVLDADDTMRLPGGEAA